LLALGLAELLGPGRKGGQEKGKGVSFKKTISLFFPKLFCKLV
jgi:hypothetical protein